MPSILLFCAILSLALAGALAVHIQLARRPIRHARAGYAVSLAFALAVLSVAVAR
jgi:hypothetical protein